MSDQADAIVYKMFERARADAAAAPLADAFAEVLAEDQWTTEALDSRVRAFVDGKVRELAVSSGDADS